MKQNETAKIDYGDYASWLEGEPNDIVCEEDDTTSRSALTPSIINNDNSTVAERAFCLLLNFQSSCSELQSKKTNELLSILSI